jgi:hypothetical protein
MYRNLVIKNNHRICKVLYFFPYKYSRYFKEKNLVYFFFFKWRILGFEKNWTFLTHHSKEVTLSNDVCVCVCVCVCVYDNVYVYVYVCVILGLEFRLYCSSYVPRPFAFSIFQIRSRRFFFYLSQPQITSSYLHFMSSWDCRHVSPYSTLEDKIFFTRVNIQTSLVVNISSQICLRQCCKG